MEQIIEEAQGTSGCSLPNAAQSYGKDGCSGKEAVETKCFPGEASGDFTILTRKATPRNYTNSTQEFELAYT